MQWQHQEVQQGGGSIDQHLYPSGSRLQTAGICLDYAVVRDFTTSTDILASAVKQWVIAKYGRPTNMERGRIIADVEYTSMTAFEYYDKGQQRETLQLSERKDCAFGPTGTALDNPHTQRENRATVCVCLGDTRKLYMQVYHIDITSHNKYTLVGGFLISALALSTTCCLLCIETMSNPKTVLGLMKVT